LPQADTVRVFGFIFLDKHLRQVLSRAKGPIGVSLGQRPQDLEDQNTRHKESEMNKLFLRSSILVLLFFTCASYTALAITLEGTALDPSGKAVPNARVSLLRSLVAIAECQTDARGNYKFEGLDKGVYQLSAVRQGLSSQSIEVDLRQQEAKKQDIKLEISALINQVVVSASLGGALAPQIGSSVDLITQQEIEDRGAQNALDVIRGVPGIEVSQFGRRGGLTNIYIRGGETKYNAVLIDGIPMNEFGGSFNMASLPVDGLERIEITRGPQSALYGSNAVTGVINLVSQKGESAPSFSGLAEGGSYSTRRFVASGNGLNRGFSWSYNLSRLDSDGVVVNDNYRNQSAFLSLGYKSSARQLDFHFIGNANDAGSPGAYGSDPMRTFWGIDKTTRVKQNLFGYQIGYVENISSKIRQVSSVSLSTNDLYYHSDYGNNSENLRGVFNTRTEIAISNSDTLTAGFEFNREQIRNTYLTDTQGNAFLLQRASLAYFVENRWSAGERFYLTTGVRVDDLRTHSLPANIWYSRPLFPANSIVKVNPRVSAAYMVHNGTANDLLGGTRLHGSFGAGIRPPDYFDLGFTNNPGLKPEKSLSFDAGIEQTILSSKAVLDFTFFQNRFHDQIVTLGSSVKNLSSYKSDNLNNSRAQGFEISFRMHPVRSLEFGGQYTFLDSTILALDGSSQANKPYYVGQQLLRRPQNSASYNVTWKIGNFMINTNAYIRGVVLDADPTYGPSGGFFTNKGYTRADVGCSYQLPGGIEVYTRINNFLNQKYEETLGYPAYHANIVGGMKFKIKSE
jgi:outer membrane cobalamin receptor